jgi:hypothetical protein
MTAKESGAEMFRQRPAPRPSPMEMPAQRSATERSVRRRRLPVELARGTIGMASIGALGGALGSLLLSRCVSTSGPFAAAFQAGIGSLIVAGTLFAWLGARGRVVFADLVGDWQRETPAAPPTLEDRFGALAVEFVGGAMWGIVCGILVGVLAGAVGYYLGISLGPTAAGTMGGGFLGMSLALLAAGSRYAASGTTPIAVQGFGRPPRVRAEPGGHAAVGRRGGASLEASRHRL